MYTSVPVSSHLLYIYQQRAKLLVISVNSVGSGLIPLVFFLNDGYQKGINIVAAEPWLTLVESFPRVWEEIAISERNILRTAVSPPPFIGSARDGQRQPSTSYLPEEEESNANLHRREWRRRSRIWKYRWRERRRRSRFWKYLKISENIFKYWRNNKKRQEERRRVHCFKVLVIGIQPTQHQTDSQL